MDTSSEKTDSQIAFDLPGKISVKELQKYEDIVPPHTTRSKAVTLPFDSNKKYYFIEFDTETTCTGKLAEFCQLSAVSENGIEEFSTFILPKGNISFGAYLVNGLSMKNIKGSRTLCKANIPVRSVSTEEAFCDFLTFLKRVKTSQNSDCVVVLIGHNAASFDVPILLRNSEMRFNGGAKVRVTGHRSQVQVTGQVRSQVTGHRSQVAGLRSQVTGHRSRIFRLHRKSLQG